MIRPILVLLVLAIINKAEAQTSALPIGDSLYAVGSYHQAIQVWDQVQPKDERLYLKLARAYQAQGNLNAALENYAVAAGAIDQTIARTEYGKLLIKTNNFKKADSIFSTLIDAYSDNPNFYYLRGWANQNNSRKINDSTTSKSVTATPSYIQDYKTAIALDSTHQKALYETAKFYLKQKEYGLVEQLCNKALASYGANVEIISILAQNYYYKGWHAEAITWFEKLLELGQKSQFIHEKLGSSYYNDHMYELAIEQYKQALTFNPEDYYLHGILAKLYNYIENFKLAEQHGLAAIYYKDLPLDADYYTLASTYKLNKKWSLAMDYLNKALAENPDLERAVYAKAVVADNYYADKQLVIKLYENYIKKFDKDFNPLAQSAKARLKMLKTEVFMADDN